MRWSRNQSLLRFKVPGRAPVASRTSYAISQLALGNTQLRHAAVGRVSHHLQAVDFFEPCTLAPWEVDLLPWEAESSELLEVRPHCEYIFAGRAGEVQFQQGCAALGRCGLEDCGW
jgi:hypothetical protein